MAVALEASVATIFAAFNGRILPADSAVAAAWGEVLAESGDQRRRCEVFHTRRP
jgi:hypothetical protein